MDECCGWLPFTFIWGFNSATALKPWMIVTPGAPGRNLYKLQFGHGVEAVDDTAVSAGWDGRKRCFNSATALKPWMT